MSHFDKPKYSHDAKGFTLGIATAVLGIPIALWLTAAAVADDSGWARLASYLAVLVVGAISSFAVMGLGAFWFFPTVLPAAHRYFVVQVLGRWTRSPLHRAIRTGSLEQLQQALTNQPDLDAVSPNRGSALHFAVTVDQAEMITALVDAGANLDVRDELGRTALHLAADLRSLELVKRLLDAHADPDLYDADGQTPVHVLLRSLAALENSTARNLRVKPTAKVLQLLLQRGADPNAPLGGPEAVIAKRGRKVICPIHLIPDAPELAYQLTMGQEGSVFTNDAECGLALHYVAAYSLAAVNRPLEHGAPVDFVHVFGDSTYSKRPFTPLMVAVAQLRALGTYYAEQCPDAPFATKPEVLSIVHRLLDAGASLEAKDKYGLTRLHVATLKGSLDAVRILVDRGAPKEAATDDGHTPLSMPFAVSSMEADRESLAAVDLLKEYGADPLVRDKKGRCLLHLTAANWANDDYIQKAVELGLGHGEQDHDGNTPLHLAAGELSVGPTRRFLDLGADRNAVNKAGRTAYDLAVESLKNSHRSKYFGKEFRTILDALRPVPVPAPPARPESAVVPPAAVPAESVQQTVSNRIGDQHHRIGDDLHVGDRNDNSVRLGNEVKASYVINITNCGTVNQGAFTPSDLAGTPQPLGSVPSPPGLAEPGAPIRQRPTVLRIALSTPHPARWSTITLHMVRLYYASQREHLSADRRSALDRLLKVSSEISSEEAQQYAHALSQLREEVDGLSEVLRDEYLLWLMKAGLPVQAGWFDLRKYFAKGPENWPNFPVSDLMNVGDRDK